MTRVKILYLVLIGLLVSSAALAGTSPADQTQAHRLVIQVSSGDPDVMNTALNNAMNIVKILGQDNVRIEVVAYGPGLKLLMKSNDRFRDRVSSMQMYNVRFAACGNTMEHMKVSKDELVPGVGVVEAGVLEIMQKEEQGWSYLRP